MVLERFGTIPGRRAGAALVAALMAAIAYLCTSYGLVLFAPVVQVGLLAGCAAGLVMRRRLDAAAAAAVGTGIAAAAVPPWFAASLPLTDAALVSIAALAAFGTASLPSRATIRTVAGWVVVAVVLANLWTTAYTLDAAPRGGEPVFTQLSATRFLGEGDHELYLRTLDRMDAGQPFYLAYRTAHIELGYGVPTVLGFRLPTLFWIWNAVTGGDARRLVPLLLALVTATCAVAYRTLLLETRSPVALAAPLLLAAYYLYAATTGYVAFSDPTAGALGVLAACAALTWLRRPTRVTVAVAVGAALAAALTRELMAFVLVAGLLAALFTRRRRDIAAWGVGALLFVAAFALHVRAIPPGPPPDARPWLHGGADQFQALLSFSQHYVGLGAWGALGLILLVLAGAALGRPAARRAYVLTVLLLPIAVFSMLGNPGLKEGRKVVYWGSLCIPIAYALSPVGLAALTPGRHASATAPAQALDAG